MTKELVMCGGKMSSAVLTLVLCVGFASAQELAPVGGVDAQPLRAQVKRVALALELAGSPLSVEVRAELERAYELEEAESVPRAPGTARADCLVRCARQPESRVKVARGPAQATLVEQGWRSFLVRVHNEAGVTARLAASSPQSLPVYRNPRGGSSDDVGAADIADRWLDLHLFTRQPLLERLSGLALEYRIIELHARDVGKREASFAFDLGQGTQDIGFRNATSILFDCLSSTPITLEVIDHDGEPTTASFEIRDTAGRIYPSPAKRLAPDFFFHPQVYRAHGETVRLPAGTYRFDYTRGPEYRRSTRTVEVPEGAEAHRDLPSRTLGTREEARLVQRRSPRSCGRLLALRQPERRCDAGGHVAPPDRRGSRMSPAF